MTAYLLLDCNGDETKFGLARDLGDRLQSRNVPFGTSGDFAARNMRTEYQAAGQCGLIN